ncbi:fatty acid desaturase [Aurantiacibacter aquimixticola]|uniref:Beta-carotene ketolase n=1 Tax=Aurantiacibacter aquimixticola TaxID=1958945 RepID=A0A419RT59_9SPHN|nr:fatty acid desaturase [Aurantiacibacter aquimixticola]RJY08956.1 beta-carotene ketolase [Aurantiacibacter aquimixticola]
MLDDAITSPAAASGARTQQAAIGLALAAAIFGSWVAIHVYAIFIFELSWATLPIALGIALVQCWLSVGLFIVSHDAMHGSLAPGAPRVNAVIGAALLFLYAGFGWRKMRDAHFDHHKHTGADGDPDFDTANPTDGLRWYRTFLTRYFGWRSALYVSLVVTVYWLVVGVPMAQIVLVYGLPAIASSVQLFYFGTYRPHHHDEHAFEDRHNARSNDYPAWLSLATCFHFGYHLEHHRHPGVPWWALPARRRQDMQSATQS